MNKVVVVVQDDEHIKHLLIITILFTFFSEFHWKDTVADKISTFYDIGGIVGNDDK